MIIEVLVKPGSFRTHLEKVAPTKYIAQIKERAEDGEANLALIKLLSKQLMVPQQKIRIKTPTARTKLIELEE